jgi:multidrug efflux pump subunit AcrB
MSNEKSKSGIEFGLSSFSIRNATSVYVLIFIITIMGILAYNSMPRESFPEIVQPTIIISAAYPGNSPADIENLVTRPIEKELKTLKDVKKFTSTSIQDFSLIIVEFDTDKKPKEALQEVKDKVDKAKSELPADLPVPPNIIEQDFSSFPVMNINLSGNFSYEEFKDYAEYLRDEIEKFPEFSEVDIRGLLKKEVEISVNLPEMESREISFDDIENAVRSENLSASAGDILNISGNGDMTRRTLRIKGEFTDPAQMENIIVKNENQRVVRLKDIAGVRFGPIEPSSFARMNGKPVVMLDVKKKSGENLINGADKVKALIENTRKTKRLPDNLDIVITNDQSHQTRVMVSSLENNIIAGVLLVVLVLLFFLGFRNSMFVGIAIPLSMIMGFWILDMYGTTLNMMVLFSLILALGMLVDNGIVVVENIYRLHSEGMNKRDASRFGVGEVAIPIIASTATTVAAFLPLLFWDSLTGEFMKYLPLTLIITLSASLFVGLVVNPVIASKYIKVEEKGYRSPLKKFIRNTVMLAFIGIAFFFMPGTRTLGSLLLTLSVLTVFYRYILLPVAEQFQYVTMVRIENGYGRFVRWALTSYRPYAIFATTFALLIIVSNGYFSSNPRQTFFPETDPQYVNVYIEMPLGTDIRMTDALTKELEENIRKKLEPNKNVVEAILAQVGEGTSDPMAGPSLDASPNKARITVSFHPFEERVHISDVRTSKLMDDIRDAVQGYPQASVSVEKNQDGPPVGKPVNVAISGDNYDTLIAVTERALAYLDNAAVPGVDKLKTDMELGKPETIVEIDTIAARRYGISTYFIAMNLRTALFGKEVSKYKEGDEDYKIQLRLQNEYRYNLQRLLDMKITFRSMTTGQIVQVPISSVAKVREGSSYGSVRRRDMDRVINIFSNVIPGYNANAIVQEYKVLMENFKMPEGYSYRFTGEQEEQAESIAFMTKALLIALFLVFLIIVTQFNSVISPFIIMTSVTFSTIGVFLGFWMFRMDWVWLMCGIGIISLAGVVVNNAIVLIDYTNLLRARKREEMGLDEDAQLALPVLIDTMVEAGRTRLRPVLLTAITTVLGLIPLAIGLNIDFIRLFSEGNPDIYIGGDNVAFWGPMSWTVIFGLTFATFLTLVVVPVMSLLSDRLIIMLKSKKN